MSLFAKTDKAKIVDQVPEKIALDLSSDSSESEDQLQQMQHEEAEEVSEPQEEPQEQAQDMTHYDPRTDTAETAEQLKQRVQRVTYVLANFSKHRNAGLSRQDYIQVLQKDICALYGYSMETTEILLGIFSPSEFVQFVQACETPRPLTIRVNTLRLKRKELAAMLIPKGVELEPVSWCHDALTIFKS